jgi:D-glycero-alpha-D-manno-heptose-7-phosphate kinase
LITTRAPLRIPLGGGGTDLPSDYRDHGGFILSVGIDKYVYIQLNTLKVEDFIRVKYSETERVDHPSKIKHPLLRESLLHTHINGGIEIGAMADIPGRTGMGSSGSFTVALLSALHAYKREQVPTQELAEEAHYIEAGRAAQPAGKHDHYLGAFGGLTCLDIDPSGKVEVSSLRLSEHVEQELPNSLVVFYTGIQRESFDILSEQDQNTQAGDSQVIDSLHEIKSIGYEIRDALVAGDIDLFGQLMHKHWEVKKKRSQQMSNSRIDRWYEVGMEAGALGGKILGAGGGGFLMFYCQAEHRWNLRERMTQEGLREMHFRFDMEGVKVLMNV